MAPKSLKYLFNICSFLAITPCYEQKVTFLRKVYSVLLMIFITTCVGVSNSYRQFYGSSMYLRVVTSILMEMVLLLFCYHTTMAVVFFKREQWQQLMKNLKIIIKALSDDRAMSRAASAAIFAVIVTLASEIFSFCVWSEVFGMIVHIQQFNVYYLEFYMFLSCNIFLCFILSLLLSSYKQLHRALLQDLFLPLKNVEYSMRFLKKTVDIFNDIFEWPIALIIAFSVVHMVHEFDYIIIVISTKTYNIGKEMAADLLLVLLIFSGTTGLIVMCDLILMEEEKILDLCGDLRRDYVKNSLQKRRFDDINQLILENFPKFSGARFFGISRSTILRILETVTTFIIISIQFRTSMNNQ
ncbi:7tm 7 domain containing protein [Asbolus verrucosus]|uniref:Gustatory receptor n=1 Tax=Asbolus verrucosus TaxID=1661398 RepID=A0A482V0M6_ASBVE|nr:7tm 7 domain containing protein [Asbolus verrucosus]